MSNLYRIDDKSNDLSHFFFQRQSKSHFDSELESAYTNQGVNYFLHRNAFKHLRHFPAPPSRCPFGIQMSTFYYEEYSSKFEFCLETILLTCGGLSWVYSHRMVNVCKQFGCKPLIPWFVWPLERMDPVPAITYDGPCQALIKQIHLHLKLSFLLSPKKKNRMYYAGLYFAT